MKRLRLSICCLLLFIVVGLFFPFQKGGYTYKNINRSDRIFIPAGDLDSKRKLTTKNGALFVKENTLYSALVLVTYVKKERWCADDLSILEKLGGPAAPVSIPNTRTPKANH